MDYEQLHINQTDQSPWTAKSPHSIFYMTFPVTAPQVRGLCMHGKAYIVIYKKKCDITPHSRKKTVP